MGMTVCSGRLATVPVSSKRPRRGRERPVPADTQEYRERTSALRELRGYSRELGRATPSDRKPYNHLIHNDLCRIFRAATQARGVEIGFVRGVSRGASGAGWLPV